MVVCKASCQWDDVVAYSERGKRGEGKPDLSYDDAMTTLKAVCKHH